jgi:hypothetical protein
MIVICDEIYCLVNDLQYCFSYINIAITFRLAIAIITTSLIDSLFITDEDYDDIYEASGHHSFTSLLGVVNIACKRDFRLYRNHAGEACHLNMK